MKWLPLALVACVTACTSSQAQESAGYTELVLHGDMIAHQIQASLAGTKGELRSDKVDPDGTRHPGSFVQFGPGMKDKRFEFSLPDKRIDLGYAGQITYRVNDIKLDTVDMYSTTREFIITASFISNGVALKGSHSALGESVVPGIKLQNMQLAIHLIPIVTPEGKISYSEPHVTFAADVDNTFIPRFSVLGRSVDIVDSLTHYRHDLCETVQTQIQKALDDPARKEALSEKIQEGIAGRLSGPSSAVLSLKFQGTDLVVRLRR